METEKWKELKITSEKNSLDSKPQNLAIIEILIHPKEHTLSSIHDDIRIEYTDKLSKRQVRYILTALEESEVIYSKSNHTNEKVYILNKPEIPTSSPLSIAEVSALSITAVIFVFTLNRSAFLIMIGIIIEIVIIQVEYFYSSRKIDSSTLNYFLKNKYMR